MKKIINIFIIVSLLFLLNGCLNTNKTEFEKFVSKVPSVITADYKLSDKFNDELITWQVDGKELADNKISYFYTDEDKAIEIKGIYKGQSATKTIKVKKTNFVTNIAIDTVNNEEITSKDDYLRAKLDLKNAGAFNLDVASFRIRGRGNSTWGYEKKPFRLNFDEDISILGMKKARNYVLLAEHNDKSLMRNYVAHYLSRFLNLPHKLETRYVNLTLNGDFKGLYLLTEQVAVSEERLNIDVSENIDGGFLIELERDFERALGEGKENRDWFRLQNPNPYDRNNGGNSELYQELYYVVKSPKLKDYDKSIIADKINYYKNYFTDFENSVSKDEYDEYINVDNFVDFFVLTELMKQVDIGYSSVFITKDKDQKMQMGPIWDFDISSGNGNYYAYGPKGFWVDYNPWFGILIKRPGFEQKYINRFNEVIDLYFDDLITEITRVEKYLKPHATENFKRWSMHVDDGFNPNPPEITSVNTHSGQVKYLVDYLTKRSEWILNTLNNEGYIGFKGDNDEGWD